PLPRRGIVRPTLSTSVYSPRRCYRHSVGRIQRRMVKGGLLVLDAAIRQPVCEEVDQVRLVRGAEPEFLNTFGLLWVGKVPTAVVEINHVSQRVLATVVKVRCGQLHVAETRRLEGAPIKLGPTYRPWHSGWALVGSAEVLGGGPHTVVMEPLIAAVFVDQAVLRSEVHGGIGQFRSGVALGARALAAEDAESSLLVVRQCARVASHESVNRSLVRTERGTTRLDSGTPGA